MWVAWYVLDDGRVVDPNEVAPDDSGTLRHSSGVAVAMRSPGVPRTSGVDAEAQRAKSLTAEEPKRGYKTREAKAK